ncbi:MAG: dTDP-4-dehydrorhamnose 3,5-epimerase [Bacteroidia bacterium]|nr:dTDP-4-dehydrorhamnose 3,5-epimerase [Bacteroidia bacterium]
MPFHPGKIPGLWVFEPQIFSDERGYFYESYNERQFKETTGFNGSFVQDNHSSSHYGVMRGLHFQKPPHAQAKLVRVTLGEVLDVAVDLRKDSPSYGQYESVRLSAENKRQWFIPRGFAHGFIVLSQEAELLYKCDNYYAPGYEGGILYTDPDLGIDWQVLVEQRIVSQKDMNLARLAELSRIF